ncbi:MAG TPA: hypothetical protein VMD52_01890 [Patescibacteria group bacterium]|nr:hypothetical protein [Patescibacteria group bacterium]
MTVWMLTVLTTFAVYLGYMIQQRILVLSKIEDNEELHFIAEAGVKRALAEFAVNKYSSAFSAMQKNCTNNPVVFKDVFVGKGNFFVAYNYKEWESAQTDLRYGFIDEESKININYAPAPVLVRLFLFVGLDNDQADKMGHALVDYRDADTTTAEGVPEQFYYAQEGRPAVMKNANFEMIDEVKLVPGMTAEIYDKIKDRITVYGSGPVNINTASVDILSILGLRPDLIAKVFMFRCGEDRKEGTEDDNRVDDLRNYTAALSRVVTLNDEEKKELEGFLLSGLLSTRSNFFSIHCTAFLNTKNKAVSISCVSDISGKIYYWKERRYMTVRRIFL